MTSEPARRWHRRAVLTVAGLVAVAPVFAGPAAATEETAEAFIRKVGDDVMAILADAAKDDAQKLSDLKILLDSYTDIGLIARLVLGRHWRSAAPEEREAYLSLFHELLMKTLAARLGDYDGQTFEVAGSRKVSEVDSTVSTRIIRVSGNPPLKVDWRVRAADGGFAIIDVVAEGVSLVVSQRNEVGSIIERNGMAGLLDTMRQRRDALL